MSGLECPQLVHMFDSRKREDPWSPSCFPFCEKTSRLLRCLFTARGKPSFFAHFLPFKSLVLPVNFYFFSNAIPQPSRSQHEPAWAGCLLAGSLVAQPHLMDLMPLPIDVPISSYLMMLKAGGKLLEILWLYRQIRCDKWRFKIVMLSKISLNQQKECLTSECKFANQHKAVVPNKNDEATTLRVQSGCSRAGRNCPMAH